MKNHLPARAPRKRVLPWSPIKRAASAVFVALFAAVVLVCASAARAKTPAGKGGGTDVLHVHVVGLRSSNGKVGCTLYNSPETFPGDASKAFRDVDASISDRRATCNFSNIPPGVYALVVIHDENGNGKFDRNFLGIPKEGYAFSNNVRPRFAPPSFKAASFAYKGGEQSLTITMRY
jgi:uncharacterized protein (DUF2141 family)